LLRAADPENHRYYSLFRDLYTYTIGGYGSGKIAPEPKNEWLLKRDMRHLMIRRLKSEVGLELPSKSHQKIPLYLLPEQVRAYRQATHDLLIQLDESDEPLDLPSVVAMITRLRQIVSGLGSLPKGGGEGTFHPDISAKLDVCLDLVRDRCGDPMVIFTMFRHTLSCLAKRLEVEGIPYGSLVAGMSSEEVQDQTAAFAQGGVPVMISTVQYGGVGHTLTAADTLVFIDKHWNPALQQQAEDRIHRISQVRPVLIMSLHVNHTVDDLVEEVLETKRGAISKVLRVELRNNLEDSGRYL
jgi:SNF2 family DNA or RNA helicase